MAPSSQELKPPGFPGRFSSKCDVQPLRNDLVGATGRNQSQHICLAARQRLVVETFSDSPSRFLPEVSPTVMQGHQAARHFLEPTPEQKIALYASFKSMPNFPFAAAVRDVGAAVEANDAGHVVAPID